jgi:hypothetical protein
MKTVGNRGDRVSDSLADLYDDQITDVYGDRTGGGHIAATGN